jgi:Secretion system C-terminal sorting domain
MHIFILLISFFAGITASFRINAQDTTLLENYEVFEVGGSVRITATIKSGLTCFGINFLRTEDTTLNFQSVGEIPGVCGSNTSSIRYDFTDLNPPKNKTLFYKIQMGGLGYSEILSIRIIDTGDKTYLVTPNPTSDHCRIYFKNELRQNTKLLLCDKNGVEVQAHETVENYFEIDLEDLPAGIYFFTAVNVETKMPNFKGKFAVHK